MDSISTPPNTASSNMNTTGDLYRHHEQSLYNMLMQAPVGIVVFRGPQYIIELANDLYLPIAGKNREELLDKPAFEAMPVAAEQGFIELLDNIRKTGEPFKLDEHPTLIERNGKKETAWLNIVYQPMKELDGMVNKIMILVTEVTSQVLMRHKSEEEEAIIRKTKNQLELSISIGHVGIWHWDVKKDIVTWSKEQLDLYGLSEGEFKGRISDFHKLVLPEDLAIVKSTAKNEMAKGGDHEYQFRIKKKDGQIRWLQGRSRSFYNTDGELDYRMGVNIDITEQKEAEEKIKESEERFRITFENAAVGIAHVGLDGKWLRTNSRICGILGYTEEELKKIGFQEITHPADLKADLDYIQQLLKNEIQTYSMEKRYIRKDGSIVWAALTVSLLYDEEGKPKHFVSILEDISVRKLAEEKVKASETHFRTLAETLPQLVWTTDDKGAYEYASHQWMEYSGLDPHDESTWQKLVHANDMEAMMNAWSKSMANGNTYQAEGRLKSKQGEYRWHFVTGEPVRNEDGRITKWIGAFTDIHDQKTFAQKLELEVVARTTELVSKNEELKLQRDFIETVLDASADIIVVLDKNFNYLAVNKKIEEQYGMSKVSIIGKNLFDVFPHLKNSDMPANLRRALSGETVVLNEHKSEIIERWFQTYFVPLKKDGLAYGVIVMGHDITGIMEATQKVKEKNIELQNTESFLQQLIDSSVEIISVLDKDLNYITANKKFESFLHISRQQLRGKNLFEINPAIKGTVQLASIEKAFNGETVYLSKRPSVARPEVYVDTYFIPLIIQDAVEGVIIMARDVTDIVATEKLLEQKNRELERSNEDLQQFAHVASHDLKEPVRKIRTFGSRLYSEFANDLPEKAKLYINKMENAASRMYDMIDGVLLFSSLGASSQPFSEIDLRKVIKNIEADLEIIIHQKEAEVIVEYLPTVYGSPVLIYQLFYNLINNSLKFSMPGRKPVIKIRNEENKSPQQKTDGFVEVVVADNGIGFNSKEAEKIFKTFSRLHSKDEYEGTGLGLALCKKIVERHGGSISVTAQEGKGAAFHVSLPGQE